MSVMTLDITPAMEDYLEGILVIQESRRIARVKDLAELMNVKAPSVNEALSNLKKKGLIAQEKYGYIELTPAGLSIARKVYSRHNTLTKFFHEVLGLNETIAEKDACKIEHYLSKETIARMFKFIKYTETCSRGAPTCSARFLHFLENRKKIGKDTKRK